MENLLTDTPAAALMRRAVLRILGRSVAAGGAAMQFGSWPDLRVQWGEFRDRFMAPEGRIVDTANGGISHSEGQGYGLLLAATHDDRPAFERILAWTQHHLRREEDGLFGWKFDPAHPGNTTDRNNATDGDIALAWGLARAGARWGVQAYTGEAARIANAVLRHCALQVGELLLLLPGASGFRHGNHVVVNPSYALFPAFRELGLLLPEPRWARLGRDFLSLIAEARFGRYHLSPDWLEIPVWAGRPRLATEWPGRFSWDAVRVPLFLAWGGHWDSPALAAASAFWAAPEFLGAPPAWWDVKDDIAAPYAATPGIQAIAALAGAACQRVWPVSGLPSVDKARDYYNAALILLSQIAWREVGGASGPP